MLPPALEIRRVVDLGCGTGRFTGLLADLYGTSVVGVEPSHKMLAGREPLDSARARFLAATAEALALGGKQGGACREARDDRRSGGRSPPPSQLVPFQLNWPNRSDAIQRMAQPAERSMAMSQVSVDPLPAYPVARVVSVREREALEHAELGFDEVEPRGLRRRRHRLDAQPPQQRQEARMIMDVAQVVHDHEEPLVRIAGPKATEGLADLGNALAAAKQAVEAVGMDIIEAQELLGAMGPSVGRAHARRPALAGPSDAPDRPEFQGAPFVEAHYRRARRTSPVEPPDAFFFRSNAGSWDVFQVRTRWAVSPSRRRSRRPHSSVTGGRSRRRRQYSASFGTDQAENGNPRSAGLDSATSTNSRSCAALRMGGRPFGFATRSKVVQPLSLNRRTQSYAAVKWQPTRSAASTTPRPFRTSSMIRYRWCTRTDRERSLSFARRTRCSPRVSERRRTGFGILSLLSLRDRIPFISQIKLERH